MKENATFPENCTPPGQPDPPANYFPPIFFFKNSLPICVQTRLNKKVRASIVNAVFRRKFGENLTEKWTLCVWKKRKEKVWKEEEMLTSSDRLWEDKELEAEN